MMESITQRKPYMARIGIGDHMPPFSLKNEDGLEISLTDFGGKLLVLFFYPKDFTPGCTAEVCGFRNIYNEFEYLAASIIGVSSDNPASHKRFIERHSLPFSLLSDTGNVLRKRLGVPTSFLGLLPGRVTYVVDGKGNVRKIIRSQFRPQRHIEEALKAVRELSKS